MDTAMMASLAMDSAIRQMAMIGAAVALIAAVLLMSAWALAGLSCRCREL